MAQDFNLTMPTERAEKYLAKMAKQYDGTLPEPISNIDKYLKILAENGTCGGSGGGITPKKLENVDLNTVTETGSYYADFDHTCKNVPRKVGSYGFSIIVTNGGGVVYQLLMKNTIDEKNRLFMRVIDSDGEVYPWSNYMQESDVIVDSVLLETSTRPPQNAIVTKRLNEIESNSAKKTDLTSYLPLSGGVMTGAIDTVTNGVDITVGSNRSNNSNPTLVAGGSYEVPDVSTNALKNYKSLIGSYHNTKTGAWFNMISVRHRNGYDDGANYGMYLYSALTNGGNLIWNKQTSANTWQGDRTLLDSVNYTSYAADKNHTHQYVPWIAMGGSGTKALYGIFASLPDTNPLLNQGATLLITDAGNFVSGQTGAWLVQISNRNNKPWMTITTLIPHADGDVQFGYYHDTANKLFYFGVYTTPYRSSLFVSTLRNDAAIIKNFVNYTSAPSGWTVVNPQYDITEAETLKDSGWDSNLELFSEVAASTLKCRLYGKLVEIRGSFTLNEPSGHTPFAKIPLKFRPSEDVFTTIQVNIASISNLNFPLKFIICQTGELVVDSGTGANLPANREVKVCVHYLID